MITYNNIIQRLENFADNHFFIARFSHGTPHPDDLADDGNYPLMHVIPVSVDTAPGQITYSFDVLVLDRPQTKDDKYEDQREVISDCTQAMQDLLAEIYNGGNIFEFDETFSTPKDISIEVVQEVFKHVITGVQASISITAPWKWDACNAPLTPVPTPASRCSPGVVLINGVEFGDVASAGELDILVEYQNGTPVGTITGDTVVIPDPVPGDDGTVVNSNATWTEPVPPGDTVVVPDVALSNSNDSFTASVPSAVPYELADITVSGTSGYSVSSPAAINITVPDATISNSNDTFVVSTIYPGQSYEIADITVTKPDASTVAYPAKEDIDVRVYQTGIRYDRSNETQYTSYVNYDAGYNKQAGLYTYNQGTLYQLTQRTVNITAASWGSLVYNNINGNTTRIEGVTIAGRLFNVDHLTGLMWDAQPYDTTDRGWTATLVLSAITGGTYYTYTDWRIPTVQEFMQIKVGDPSLGMIWATITGAPAFNFWTGNTYEVSTGSAWRVTGSTATVSTATKGTTTNNRLILVRTHLT